MEVIPLRMYFKAGVLVPFYVSCVISVLGLISFSSQNTEGLFAESAAITILKANLYSGLTGLASFSIFLNRLPSVAFSPLKSFLSWFALPYGLMTYFITTAIPWEKMQWSNTPADLIIMFYMIIFFLHFIGLIISFIDFRKSMMLREKNKGNTEF